MISRSASAVSKRWAGISSRRRQAPRSSHEIVLDDFLRLAAAHADVFAFVRGRPGGPAGA
ncbi:hypothetical protein [Streptomyces sp. NPDC021356]|uniref:hypothetical protein n=1 Tax=Streptomyces sp. NPDC021356 TaxID=3154900 RepID=UPI0033D339A2